MKLAAFLDRDGVLNKMIVKKGSPPRPPAQLNELAILPGVERACSRLRKAGFLLIMVTNQPDVARGIYQRENVDEINRVLQNKLRIDSVKVCFHDDCDRCNCRKPKPGMITRSAREFQIDLTGSFMIGDTWKDIEAGLRAGCRTILIESGQSENLTNKPEESAESLEEAVQYILKTGSKNGKHQ